MSLAHGLRSDFASLLAATLGLAFLAPSAAGASTIQDRADYRPSTDITFADSSGGSLTGGELSGDTFGSGEFQLNVAYYNNVPADRAAIDQFDDKCLNGQPPADCTNPTSWNFTDAVQYTVDITLDSSANIYADDPSQIIGTADWTITGTWGGFSHTIFYGDVIDNDASLDISGGDFLDNSGGYHSFPGSGWANANEVWNQHVLPTDIGGYTVSSQSASVGLLSVALVPEPSTALLLTLGLSALVIRLRHR